MMTMNNLATPDEVPTRVPSSRWISSPPVGGSVADVRRLFCDGLASRNPQERPNYRQAQSFLTALDEDADNWTFQTLDDSGANNKSLIRLFHGSLDSHADDLAMLNQQGAGVFVTINETNGKGRRKADIQRIRALYVDLDGSPLGSVQTAAPAPHIIVASSPGRFHAYWRVSDCQLQQCEPALKQLIAKHRADPACSDRSRVLRLPGFFHRKRDPFLVRIMEVAPGECRMVDFGFQEFGWSPPQKYTEDDRGHHQSSSVGVEIPVWTLPSTDGERNKCLFQLARYLKGVKPDAYSADLRVAVAEWHRLALPVIGTKEFSTTWADFLRGWDKVTSPHGVVMNAILQAVNMDGGTPASIMGLGYGAKSNLLVRICKHLQRHAGAEPFFVSARQAGELIDMDFSDAAKVLQALVADRVLELVKRGSGKQASRYRYIWPE